MSKYPRTPRYVKTCSIQISTPLTDYPYVYEITLAFSTALYSYVECLTAIHEATKLLNEWLTPMGEVERTIFVIEYTKRLQPHVHIAVCCNEPLEPSFRSGIKQGLIRTFKETRVTFSNVVSCQAFNDYLEKDLEKNESNTSIVHQHKSEFIF